MFLEIAKAKLTRELKRASSTDPQDERGVGAEGAPGRADRRGRRPAALPRTRRGRGARGVRGVRGAAEATGIVLLRDARAADADQAAFLDMMEDYFAQPEPVKLADAAHGGLLPSG